MKHQDDDNANTTRTHAADDATVADDDNDEWEVNENWREIYTGITAHPPQTFREAVDYLVSYVGRHPAVFMQRVFPSGSPCHVDRALAILSGWLYPPRTHTEQPKGDEPKNEMALKPPNTDNKVVLHVRGTDWSL